MMKSAFKKNVFAAALVAGSMAVGQPAFADTYTIDPRHSFVEFVISHLGFSLMQGNFNDLSGSFEYDPKKPNEANVSVVIKTKSVDTNDAERDKHIRNEDFLHVDKFPEATFTSTKATLDEKGGKLEGKLTLHGVTKPITINVNAIGAGDDPWGGYRRGYLGETTIKRSDFDMRYNLGPLADEVKLRLFIEGIKKK
ncbi:MAG: YceI family protein [Pseudomonadota bacterium]